MKLDIPKPEKEIKDIEMSFAFGDLTITGISRNDKVVVNEVEYIPDVENSIAILHFERNSPPIFYAVRMKNSNGKRDRRLGFFY